MHTSRPTTTTVLLESLKDSGNNTVWRDFDTRYRPIIFGVARRMGLGEDDAAEVAQQTLADFARAYRAGQYERGDGRLSSWIIGIARHRALDLFRANARHRGRRGESAMIGVADGARLTTMWEIERRRAIRDEALAVLRTQTRLGEATLRAFELFVVRGVPAGEVAAQCAMSADEVYVAKARATKRLREIVSELVAAYEEE